MLSTLLLIYLVHSARGDADKVIPRCSDSDVPGMKFSVVEGYVGRYNAELCTLGNNTVGKEWKTELNYFDSLDFCDTPNKLGFGMPHSTNVEYVSEHNCTHNQTVCISAPFDLIFGACYLINTMFDNRQSESKSFRFNVNNTYTKEFFENLKVPVDVSQVENYMSLKWHTGVPVLAYEVKLCNKTDPDSCDLITNCTTENPTTVNCGFQLEYGECYKIYFKHISPWINGIFTKLESVTFFFCCKKTGEMSQEGSAYPWRLTLAWCGAALGAGAALAALGWLGAGSAAAATRRKAVLRAWLLHRWSLRRTWGGASASASEGEGQVEGEGEGQTARHVLLLYAREGPMGARAVAALRAALQACVPGEVYDIYQPAVMAQCAGAPHAWVRGVLARADARVLVLQSPALHALYADRAAGAGAGAGAGADIKLGAPLLGRREPHCGDALLHYALRLLTERAHALSNYRNYYIATISELPTEILPCLVPYRRYALPDAADLLLRDIGTWPASACVAQLLDALRRQLTEFAQHARDNPDYLMDELMVLEDE